ncbi:MAG: T9SS type A sorting domain-containing protein [Bacteroidetes bacterium]|nr:T9SS type A sorting domain-containing protein [Bacteroidota bacterium]
MKTIFTFLTLLLTTITVAQTSMFVHTAEASTISADASFIDHPDLNGNPDAKILISHNWNPAGASGIYNDNNTGAFYSAGQSQWAVYNEDGSSMIENSAYNIYIAQGSEVFLHIADAANQGSSDSYSVLSHPDLNNNPDANIILTTYYNPNSMRNDFNYSVWYNTTDGRWIIFTESLATLPLDTAFFVGIGGGTGVSAKHVATASTISGNYTIIDHPLLNGDPNATFNFTHNWGASGETSNVLLDATLGAWYTGSNWSIYTEDLTAMPEDIEFDLFVYDSSLGSNETAINELSYFPNPISEVLTITAAEELSKVTVFNVLGQQVLQQELSGISSEINMNALPTGNYLAKVETEVASQVIKLVKL